MKQDKDYETYLYLMITIVLIALKAFGLVELSWIWVLSPIWVPLGICFALTVLLLTILGIVVVIGLAVYLIDVIKERINERNENSKKGQGD